MHNHKDLSLPWDDLRLVLAIARNGGLSGAARALGVRHSTVFRRLGSLERTMGVRFFERFRDGYAPTPAGEAAAALAARLAEEVLGLERRLAGQDLKPSGTVRVTTTDTLALAVVVPLVAAFRKAQPEIAIELTLPNAFANLTRREADIAIRPTPEPPEGLAGHLVAELAYAVYGAPEYLSGQRAHSGPAPGVDFLQSDWIGWDDALAGSVGARWMRQHVPPDRVGFRADSLVAMREAARTGMGLTLLPCFFGDGVVGLARATPEPLPDLRSGLWLLTHQDLRYSARVRAVMDFMSAGLARERPVFEGTWSG